MPVLRKKERPSWHKPSAVHSPVGAGLSLAEILRAWYPLALSWTVMSMEGVVINAILARMPNPEINLAAYGGVAFAIAFVISSPIAMMLATSTALAKNWQAYQRLRKFMLWLGLSLTLLYAVVAFSPLYDFVVVKLIGAPPEIIEPGRLGLKILIPFPWLVGLRRLPQGVMIRFGQSGGVTMSTIVRLISETTLMLIGFLDGRLPGIVVATGSQTFGMIMETIYANLRVRPILQYELREAPVDNPLTWRDLSRFYLPLVITTIITFSFQFINSAGLSRMPMAIESLAVFPVVSSLSWLLQSPGVAWNEVVVALADRPRSVGRLRRFTVLLFVGTLLLTLVFLVTPLSKWWFHSVASLVQPLDAMANNGMWFMLVGSGLVVLQCWFQGLILHGRNTRGITESVIVSMIVEVALIAAGIAWGKITGLYVGLIAYMLSYASQIFWLYLRSRPVMAQLKQRDGEIPS